MESLANFARCGDYTRISIGILASLNKVSI